VDVPYKITKMWNTEALLVLRSIAQPHKVIVVTILKLSRV